MKKIAMKALALLLVLLTLCTNAVAEMVTPRASDIFESAYVSLSADKVVTASVSTFWSHATLRIMNGWVEYEDENGWHWCADIPELYVTVHDWMKVSSQCNVADRIGTGTYRVGVRFFCDGLIITRYSLERTF